MGKTRSPFSWLITFMQLILIGGKLYSHTNKWDMQIRFSQPTLPERCKSYPLIRPSRTIHTQKQTPDPFCKPHWAHVERNGSERCCVSFRRLADAAGIWWGTGLCLSGTGNAAAGRLPHRWTLSSPLHKWTKWWFACFGSVQCVSLLDRYIYFIFKGSKES